MFIHPIFNSKKEESVKSFKVLTIADASNFTKSLKDAKDLIETYNEFVTKIKSEHDSIVKLMQSLKSSLTKEPRSDIKDLPGKTFLGETQAVYKQFPTIGTTEIEAAKTKGESADSLYSKLQILEAAYNANSNVVKDNLDAIILERRQILSFFGISYLSNDKSHSSVASNIHRPG